MTASDAKSFAKASVSLLLAITAPILLALLLGAWDGKESVRDHQSDISAISSDVQRILDVVCENRKDARACK